MKQIKQLKSDYWDLETNEKDHTIAFRRAKALEKWLELNIPNNIQGKYSTSIELGSTAIRIFITLTKDDEQSTINLIRWLSKVKKQKFTIEKFWRKERGYFSYRVNRQYKGFVDYILLFENTANIDGCVIVEKEETRKIFVTDCEKESVIF